MVVQIQNSNFAARLGGRIAAANAEHRDKPVDLGNRRLPGGIKNGIAKLYSIYTKEETEDKKKTPKGFHFFRAECRVLSPKVHDGISIEGMPTMRMIPIADLPEVHNSWGVTPAVTAGENWYEIQNISKMLGITPPPTDEKNDPDSSRTTAYYNAAWAALLDPQRPVYITFSTRSWKSPQKPSESAADYAKREPMVFEEWHGLADPGEVAKLNAQHDPGAGVTERNGTAHANPAATQPEPFQDPPQGVVVYPDRPDHDGGPTNADIHGMAPDAAPEATLATYGDLQDEVEALIAVAMDDPEGATDDGREASARLEELAWEAGWTREQTAGAENWEEVGRMALEGGEEEASANTEATPSEPTVGSRWKFCKRTKDGQKAKNNKGVEFPPLEVEVATVDPAAKTCTLKTVKDGKDVINVVSKQPIVAQWDWLEQ